MDHTRPTSIAEIGILCVLEPAFAARKHQKSTLFTPYCVSRPSDRLGLSLPGVVLRLSNSSLTDATTLVTLSPTLPPQLMNRYSFSYTSFSDASDSLLVDALPPARMALSLSTSPPSNSVSPEPYLSLSLRTISARSMSSLA